MKNGDKVSLHDFMLESQRRRWTWAVEAIDLTSKMVTVVFSPPEIKENWNDIKGDDHGTGN